MSSGYEDARNPLTAAQEGIWFGSRLDPPSPAYQTGEYVELHGELDVEAFRAAVRTAMSEADGLTVLFGHDRSGPRARPGAAARPELAVVDVDGDPEPLDAGRAGEAARPGIRAAGDPDPLPGEGKPARLVLRLPPHPARTGTGSA
ncbi:condensation domain-containing protein [Amycolatopsis sp. A1MSW2902]|uniref:condensation domain-containing protein n=1 Tax=Amycolatopsis sp. A1MSW2902 TaxID=687413 RepID=UPI003FCDDB9C